MDGIGRRGFLGLGTGAAFAAALPAVADTVFETGDKLTVFGNYQTICKTFHAREHFADD